MPPNRALCLGTGLLLILSACSKPGAEQDHRASTHTSPAAASTATPATAPHLEGTWQPTSHVYFPLGDLRIGHGELAWKPCGQRAFHVAASSNQGTTLRLDGVCSMPGQTGARFNIIRLQPAANSCDMELSLLGSNDDQGTHLLARGIYSRAGCTPAPASPSSAGHRADAAQPRATDAPLKHLDDATLGLRLDYPSDFTVRHDFRRRYMIGTQWKAYANPDSKGTPRWALVLDGSNTITAAELRIGTSTEAKAVQQCLTAPGAAHGGRQGYVDLNGTPFYSFRASDAGMSHYMETRSYRVVQNGRCYAIDLIVSGVNPDVYSPPATPPFSRQQAFARLEQALRGLHLTQPAT